MLTAFDEASVTGDDNLASTMRLIIHHSDLAKELKYVYERLLADGKVIFYLNQWVEINFCLPHKIHDLNTLGKNLSLEPIYRLVSSSLHLCSSAFFFLQCCKVSIRFMCAQAILSVLVVTKRLHYD